MKAETIAALAGVAAVVVGVVTTWISLQYGAAQAKAAHDANQIPAFVDLFREHRSDRLADARTFVASVLQNYKVGERGLAALPRSRRGQVRDLLWFYDNVGALVAHGIVDCAPVSAYLGGSALLIWEKAKPLIEAERRSRESQGASAEWQLYFENLVALVEQTSPRYSRAIQPMFVIDP